jgi:hypothetical protein
MYDYAAILAGLQQIDQKAHIAGGAVRDTLLGKAIHDIDIFAPNAIIDEAARWLRLDHSYVKVGDWEMYEGFSDPAMTRVAKFERADAEIPVCLIGLKSEFASPHDNIGRFDFGICMASWDGEAVIRDTGFVMDAEAKRFTLYRADDLWQFTYSMSRYRKITRGRYAGWDLSIPETFAELAAEYALRQDYYYDDLGERHRRQIKGWFGEQMLRTKERMETRT